MPTSEPIAVAGERQYIDRQVRSRDQISLLLISRYRTGVVEGTHFEDETDVGSSSTFSPLLSVGLWPTPP